MKRLALKILLTASIFCIFSVSAQAADYDFETDGTPEYYADTSYEGIYGARYNYGGPNLIDYQIPELEYGVLSTTQTGVMEKAHLPDLQASVATSIPGGGGYGITTASGAYVSSPKLEIPTAPTVVNKKPAYTSVEDMARKDGSIGTVKIPSLGINMKVWEGETNTSMAKGLGHYRSTSAWDGNVGVCGHNRGAKYVIGAIKDLEKGDTITYTTIHGTRTYAVEFVKAISNDDWSYLQATADNRITITTCLANRPEKRICVQAVEVK